MRHRLTPHPRAPTNPTSPEAALKTRAASGMQTVSRKMVEKGSLWS